MNRGELIAVLALRISDVGLPYDCVDKSFEALLEAVRARLGAGQGVFWPGVGTFKVIECAERNRFAFRSRADGGWWRVLRKMPPYKKVSYRRSVLFNKIR